jgi:GNAT superfamily N-acetyltransferase
MHRIRLAVAENRLSRPDLVTERSYCRFIGRQSAWVAESSGVIVGFAILDLEDASVWALFVRPGAERAGIGRALHDRLIRCAIDRGLAQLRLTTAPGTRAEFFYAAAGWQPHGTSSSGEVQFRRVLKRK